MLAVTLAGFGSWPGLPFYEREGARARFHRNVVLSGGATNHGGGPRGATREAGGELMRTTRGL